jgi:NAD(P)H-dependent FMN reductase
MRSAIKTAAPSLSIAVFSSLAQVPLFNADLAGDDEAAPPAVRALRKAIASANGFLISTRSTDTHFQEPEKRVGLVRGERRARE